MAKEYVVLKFGSSVLGAAEDVHLAIHEIYSHIRLGHRVISVVSAIGDETDVLSQHAALIGNSGRDRHIAALLATGEDRAAAFLALAADRVGLDAKILKPTELGLAINGSPLDAEPTDLDISTLTQAADAHDLVIVPGFYGLRDDGEVGLLGRGGSDLTALYIGARLNAVSVKLVKDVDGVYDRDPNKHGDLAQFYDQISWVDASAVAGKLIQPKSIEFARKRGISFAVGRCGNPRKTCVGGFETKFGEQLPKALRVGLMGLGTVGYGCFERILEFPDLFEIGAILVRQPGKIRPSDVPVHLIISDAVSFGDDNFDVLIDAMGGLSPASDLVKSFLEQGCHVISANKKQIATDLPDLRQLSAGRNASLRFGAAVGGGVPMLEILSKLAAQTPIKRIEAVLNGTTNYILDRVGAGVGFAEALKEAQDLGFAEDDSTDDVEGFDAQSKALLVMDAAFQNGKGAVDQVLSGITNASDISVADGHVLRHLVLIELTGTGLQSRIELTQLPKDHFIAGALGEQSRMRIELMSGEFVHLSGKGAGRWPTTEAVIGDLLETHSQIYNHFNGEPHLVDRLTFKKFRSDALSEW